MEIGRNEVVIRGFPTTLVLLYSLLRRNWPSNLVSTPILRAAQRARFHSPKCPATESRSIISYPRKDRIPRKFVSYDRPRVFDSVLESLPENTLS